MTTPTITPEEIERLEKLLEKAAKGHYASPTANVGRLFVWDVETRKPIRPIIADIHEPCGYGVDTVAWPDGTAGAYEACDTLRAIAEFMNAAPALLALAKAGLARPVAGVTADGVTVRVGDRVWASSVIDKSGARSRIVTGIGNFTTIDLPDGRSSTIEEYVCNCYSTESAARAACDAARVVPEPGKEPTRD